jgi:probable HAF family extracellular repeat protein
MEMKMTKLFRDSLSLPSLSRNIAPARRELIRGACLLAALLMTACAGNVRTDSIPAGSGFFDLGNLNGKESEAKAVSADGGTVVGISTTASGDQHAFRWRDGVMTDLGALGNNDSSMRLAVSADGSVVVGTGVDSRAFRWTAATGTQAVADWLRTNGVVVPANVTLTGAVAVSADGNVVVSNGTDGKRKFTWLARVSPANSGSAVGQPRNR